MITGKVIQITLAVRCRLPRSVRLNCASCADARLRILCQPARQSCTALCVCASTGLNAKDAARPSQLGQSLTDHNGSAGGATAAPSLWGNQQTGALAAMSTVDAEVSNCGGIQLNCLGLCVICGAFNSAMMQTMQVITGQPSSGRKPPWNKGQSIPEETRAKISLAQKRRWKKNPGLRAAIGAKLTVSRSQLLPVVFCPKGAAHSLLRSSCTSHCHHMKHSHAQGKTPWNKGLKMGDETRAKMSAARLNSTHLRATRKKMSQSHTGMHHSPVRSDAVNAHQCSVHCSGFISCRLSWSWCRTAAALTDALLATLFGKGGRQRKTCVSQVQSPYILQATLEALSAKLTGRAKPEDHRQAIAAAQRRRHAACRMLRAIEEVSN